MKQLKLGSLFDGISAFPLAAQRNGIEPIWASEIEPFPIRVSRQHFPGMKHLGSVTDICLCAYVTHFKGTQCQIYINNSQDIKVEPVDIITFGSPCQDLSVAGKRSGLEGERSGLFYEAVRIIDEMRDATNGQYPTFAIWENVPGAFSSNDGGDFAHVISSLVGAEVHCPEEGWTSAGVAFGPKSQVAWRVLDAKYWVVPQRRRRIFLVADFRGERAGEILFVEQGMRGDTAEGRKAGEEVAGGIRDGVKGTIHPIVTGTLCASGAGMSRPAGMASETDLIIAFGPNVTTPTYAFSAGQSAKAGYIWFQKEIAPTLRAGESGTNQTPTIIEPIAFNRRQDPVSGKVTGALLPTLLDNENAGPNQYVCGTFQNTGQGWWNESDIATTLRTARGGDSVKANLVGVGYRVRRLIPLECERLMGFPDNWTEGGGATQPGTKPAVTA